MKPSALAVWTMIGLGCGGAKPAEQPANRSASGSAQIVAPPTTTPDLAATAATLELPITGLEALPAATEPTATDAGQMFGVRFMPENRACVGLPTKVKGVYIPTFAPPGEAEGELVLAPGLTLDALTACYVALGGKPAGVRVLGPKARELPGLAQHAAFIELGDGWLFVGAEGRAVDQLVRLRLQTRSARLQTGG